MNPYRRALIAAVVVLAATAVPSHAATTARVLPVPRAAGADGGRPMLTKNDWLSVVNFYRETAGVARLTNVPSWTPGEVAHARYMAGNRAIGHAETRGRPYYSAAGDTAARNSNVVLSYGNPTTDRWQVESWMIAPFHAAGMVDPTLARTAFGKATVGGWTGAALDVLRGDTSYGPPSSAVVWPGNGAQVPLTLYDGTEHPDPLSFCPGYRAPTGLPILALLPAGVRATSSTLARNGKAVGHCRFDSRSAGDASARADLASRNALVILPRVPLDEYVPYTVTVATTAGTMTWTFTAGEVTPPARVAVGGGAAQPLQASTSFPVSWSAYDTQSGVATYDVRYRSGPVGGTLSAPTTWQSATAATGASFTGTPGTTYCFSARATDRAGNRSGWSGERCTSLPFDNRALTPSPLLWLTQADTAYYAATASTALTSGSTLTFDAQRVRRVAVLVSRCSGCGTLDVSFGGRRIGSVSLDGPNAHRVLLPVATFATPASGTVTLTVTSNLAQVVVEGLGLAP
jgi:hypothetical protein